MMGFTANTTDADNAPSQAMIAAVIRALLDAQREAEASEEEAEVKKNDNQDRG